MNRWAIDVPLSPPKGGTKRDYAVLPVNSIFRRKSLLQSFFMWKLTGGKVVATLFLYLTVHRRIANDVPIYLKLHSKWPTLSENADFDRFCLIMPQTWELAKKSWIVISRKSIVRFSSSHRLLDEPCALPHIPQCVAQDENFYILFLRYLLYLRCR